MVVTVNRAAAGGGDKSNIIFDKVQRVYYHTGKMKVVAGGRGSLSSGRLVKAAAGEGKDYVKGGGGANKDSNVNPKENKKFLAQVKLIKKQKRNARRDAKIINEHKAAGHSTDDGAVTSSTSETPSLGPGVLLAKTT